MRTWGWLVWLLAWAISPLLNCRGAIILPTLGSLRGSIGDLTFSHNKGGDYCRLRSTPTNPNSSRQQSTRAHLGMCAAYWSNDLDPAERAQWTLYASLNDWINALGQTIKLTGLDWFCMLNARLLDAGIAIVDTPDDPSAPNGFLTMAMTIASATTVDIAFTPGLPGGGAVQLWGSGPIGEGQNPNFRQMRLVGYSPADQATPWTATLPWTMQANTDLKVYAAIMSEYGRISVMLDDRDTWSP